MRETCGHKIAEVDNKCPDTVTVATDLAPPTELHPRNHTEHKHLHAIAVLDTPRTQASRSTSLSLFTYSFTEHKPGASLVPSHSSPYASSPLTPFRKGCVVNGHTTTASNKQVKLPRFRSAPPSSEGTANEWSNSQGVQDRSTFLVPRRDPSSLSHVTVHTPLQTQNLWVG